MGGKSLIMQQPPNPLSLINMSLQAVSREAFRDRVYWE